MLREVKISPLYESAALLPANAPPDWDQPFYNAVLQAEVDSPPLACLTAAQKVEQQLQRQKQGHWSPRTADIDLLAYDCTVMATGALTLPHPAVAQRDFVCVPWADIAPDLRLPGMECTMAELCLLQGYRPHDDLRLVAKEWWV